MTDSQRMFWVKNDQHLTGWHKQSRTTLRQFVTDNRAEIDHAIQCVLETGRRTSDCLLEVLS